MEIIVTRDDEKGLEVEEVGEDHTLCNALREVLNEHKKVEYAAYKIDHLLLSNPRIYFKTKEKAVPKVKKVVIELTKIKGIGEKKAEKLKNAGIKTANDLLRGDIEKVSEESGMPLKDIKKYVSEAKKLVPKDPHGHKAILKEALKKLEGQFSKIKTKFQEAT